MGSMLANVTTEQVIRPPRIVIHGKGGVGKTTFGVDAPDSLLMPLEDGRGKLRVKALPRPTSYEDVMNSCAELANDDHSYRTLVVDTVDHLEPLIWNSVCAAGKKTHIEDFGYGKGYTKADPYWIDWFRSLDALRAKGMTVVVLCHNEEKTIDDPRIGAYTRTMPKLHKRANALLYEWADICGYLDIERVARDIGKDGRETRTAKTTGQRILFLEDAGGFVAKNRYDLPPQIMIPKKNPYSALRNALITAMGLDDKPVTTTEPKTKEAA